MQRFRPWLLSLALVGLGVSAAHAAEPLKAERYEQLRAAVKPDPDEEKWLSIPWQTNLWEARQKAAREGKPILLWEMDGHPLGCV